ncbi:hypothetical protein Unana1_08770 [Umbelopsis nana]
MSNLLGLAGRRRLLSTNTIRYYSTVDSEPPRRSNKWLIIGSTALLGAVAYRYIEAQRRETERANAGRAGVVHVPKQDTQARLGEAKQRAGDLYDEAKQRVDADSKDVSAAKDSLLQTTKNETANVTEAVRGAANNIAGETDTLLSQAKKAVQNETDWVKKEYEHAKGVLRDEKDELKREADKFAAEHHLKEGDTPTDQVVAGSRGERSPLADEWEDKKEKVLSEKERLEREAKGVYEDAKQEASGFWASLKGNAQDKKAEVEQQAQSTYDKALSEKERLEQQAKGTYNEAKQEASGRWSGLKNQAQEKKAEAEQQAEQFYNKARDTKDQYERSGRQAADEARGEFYETKEKAEQKASEVKYQVQSEADRLKNRAQATKVEATSTLASIVNDAKEKINQTFVTREDGRRHAAAVVAEERPLAKE